MKERVEMYYLYVRSAVIGCESGWALGLLVNAHIHRHIEWPWDALWTTVNTLMILRWSVWIERIMREGSGRLAAL